MAERKGYVMKLWELITRVASVTVVVVAGLTVLAMAFLGIPRFIDDRIDKRVHSPEFIRKVAARISPASVIFDHNGTILFDEGAMKCCIDSIDVFVTRKGKGLYAEKIVVHCKEVLLFPPILQPLDPDTYIIAEERGPPYDWIYNLELTGSSSPNVTKRFRLDVWR